MHDFRMGAIDQFLHQESMFAMKECVDQFEITHQHFNLGLNQVLYEKHLSKKFKGFIRMLESSTETPFNIALCYKSV